MAQTFTCSIVTPTETVFDEDVVYVSFPAWDGQQGVMAGQSPLLSPPGTGALRVDLPGGETHWYLLERGFAQVQDGALTLLTDRVTPAGDLSVEDAEAALGEIMTDRRFGEAGARVVVEERMEGEEASYYAITDGEHIITLAAAQDHKRALDGDEGENTGGMGAYSPPGWFSEVDQQWIRENVTEAIIKAMYDEGLPYRGVLYPGILCADEGMMVLEFNSRFGDPEAQVLFPRMESDLLEVMWAVANNKLADVKLRWSDQACVGVVLASGGYPVKYETGLPIEGLDDLDPDVLVFHAGTARQDDGTLVTSGGRVLTVSALGPNLQAARDKAYRNVERISFEGMHYRRDIGARAAAAAN